MAAGAGHASGAAILTGNQVVPKSWQHPGPISMASDMPRGPMRILIDRMHQRGIPHEPLIAKAISSETSAGRLAAADSRRGVDASGVPGARANHREWSSCYAS